VSVAQLRQLVGVEAALGCDCALFLDTAALLQGTGVTLPGALRPGRYLVSAFGRSGAPTEQKRFAARVAQRLGLAHVDMPWLATGNEEEFLRRLLLISQAACCVSDIYHVTVSALRERVPVLCLARSGRAANTIDDEKKRLLFYGYGLKECLVDIDELLAMRSEAAVSAFIDEHAERLRDARLRAILHELLPAHVAEWRPRLLDLLAAGG